MTTIAYHQYTNIPYMSGSYASSPVIGPLSTNRYPHIIRNSNPGVLIGRHPNPPKFYPSDNSGGLSNNRVQYLRTSSSNEATHTGLQNNPNPRPTSFFCPDTQRSYLTSNATKYIAPQDSGSYMATIRSRAIGKSGYKQGLSDSAPASYKNYNKNDVKNALRFARAGGCVAPPKQGSIYNTSLCNSRACAIGSSPHNKYYYSEYN
jgi:hypothetical protein